LNLLKHGLDFVDAPDIFEGVYFSIEDLRKKYGETRHICYGTINKTMVVMAYTERGNNIRIISLRKANEREKARFQNRLGSP